MKKLFIAILVLIIIALTCIYLFIPSSLNVSKVAIINCSPEAAYRILSETDGNKNWWRNQNSNEDTLKNNQGFFLNGNDTFSISKRLHSSVQLEIRNGKTDINSELFILPVSVDTVSIQWKAVLNSSSNPIGRVENYLDAVQLKKKLSSLVDNMKSYLENKEKVYGIKIDKVSTHDTLLVATKGDFTNYPNTGQLYGMIEKLQQHLYKKGAQQTAPPMVNITNADSGYHVMVALPTNTKLENEGDIFIRKLVPGNFLIAEVKGGNKKISDGFDGLKTYIDDYRKLVMAIPFQSLLSDRRKDADSTKWITRLYYPVAR